MARTEKPHELIIHLAHAVPALEESIFPACLPEGLPGGNLLDPFTNFEDKYKEFIERRFDNTNKFC